MVQVRAAGRLVRAARVTVAGVAATAALAGCGAEATSSEDAARASVQSFLAACAHDDPHAALGLLTGLAGRRFAAAPTTIEGCQETLPPALENLPLDVGTFLRISVGSASVHGDVATVDVRPPDGRTATAELEDAGDGWRLTGRGG